MIRIFSRISYCGELQEIRRAFVLTAAPLQHGKFIKELNLISNNVIEKYSS
jgi:hypothetical protein